jgi:hypothetical protein
MVSEVVTVAEGFDDAVCRTHTLCPGLIDDGAVENAPVQPIAYSPFATAIWASLV